MTYLSTEKTEVTYFQRIFMDSDSIGSENSSSGILSELICTYPVKNSSGFYFWELGEIKPNSLLVFISVRVSYFIARVIILSKYF